MGLLPCDGKVRTVAAVGAADMAGDTNHVGVAAGDNDGDELS
jgi:hypothetical protein